MDIIAISQDPIYIGTGGFTIGRVDNTIVRDPITRIPKIPGTSVAGTWRYYMALELYSYFRNDYKKSRKNRNGKDIEEIFIDEAPKDWVKGFEGNRYAAIKCAGQDDEPNSTIDDSQKSDTGHCGSCIVCKTFGFSKKGKSERGMAYFSDLNILLFPVYTRFGTRWITSKDILKPINIEVEAPSDGKVIVYKEGMGSINLGWLNFKTEQRDINEIESHFNKFECFNNHSDIYEKIIVVPDNIICQIVNSNLETRTSVSINPITGAAKEGALFTSEAIPRGTVFYGNIRIEERPLSDGPSKEYVKKALKDSKKYFETLGIGGMTTRGFGRLKISDWDGEKDDD